MDYQQINFRIEGVSPLIMHNGRLADPLNPFTRALKEMTSKKKKTDDDIIELAHREFLGGLYTDDKGSPIIPGEVIEACLAEGAKKTRQGKDVKAGIICDGDFQLIYKGPRDPEALWMAGFYKTVGAGVNRSRVMRTRPFFSNWALEFTVDYMPDVLNKSDVETIVKAAGRAGLCDWRPRHGRFEVSA